MKQVLFSLILLLACLSAIFAQHVDTSKYAILYDTSVFHNGIFPSNHNASVSSNYIIAALNEKEVDNVEGLVNACIKQYNAEAKKKYQSKIKAGKKIKLERFIIDIKNYKRQYIAAKALNGDKIIWINFFCQHVLLSDWQRESVFLVADGGNCFFNLKINLTENTFYDLDVNGEVDDE